MPDPISKPETDDLENAPGMVHENLEGWVPSLASEEEIRIALEKAFDYLQYQHLSKRLDVSSEINRHTLVRLFRILGNTSSGSSFEFLAAAKLARFIQGGLQEIYGGEKYGTHTFGVVVLQRLTHDLQEMTKPALLTRRLVTWLLLTQLGFLLYLATRN